MSSGAEVVVDVGRMPRWADNFATRHGPTSLVVRDGVLAGEAADGSTYDVRLPFDRAYDGPPDLSGVLTACEPPARWGVLLVRKGGFAVALLEGAATVASKVGQRHVQGRTKAGGQSQQRFARRRDNQARAAYDAAADHAVRVLGQPGSGDLPVVTGGDHEAVAAVLADRRLAALEVVAPWLPVPDPRRSVLEQAVLDAQALRVSVRNA